MTSANDTREHTQKDGLPSGKEGEITKCGRVNVDLQGPKTVKNKNGWKYKIHVMTMINPVTGWFKQAQLYETPTASRCIQIFDNTWLACYP